MKKNTGPLLFILLFCVVFTGCKNSNDLESRNPTFTHSMNFYKEEFEEEYCHYEKDLQVLDDSAEILIVGQTSSGKIDIEIVCIDDNEKETYTFEIEGVISDSIVLSDGHSNNWIVIVDCHEDTEGSFTVSVK